jgi:hypothetical protein
MGSSTHEPVPYLADTSENRDDLEKFLKREVPTRDATRTLTTANPR